jgi:hypothetical protein
MKETFPMRQNDRQGISMDNGTLDSSASHHEIDYEKWRHYLRPSPHETKWRAIPWRIHLAAALLEARQAEKPVLLWVMNGHPAGHT